MLLPMELGSYPVTSTVGTDNILLTGKNKANWEQHSLGLVKNVPGTGSFLHVCTSETCIFMLLRVPRFWRLHML